MRFTSGYITAPQCIPSRAGILTGRYQQKFGLDQNGDGKVDMSDAMDAVTKKGGIGGMLGGLFGK